MSVDPYNDGYTHEALHATHIVMETLDRHVIEARATAAFPDVKEAAERAHQALFDLYQLIGSKFEDGVSVTVGLPEAQKTL